MDDVVDFEERLAARLLGLPVEADPPAIRGRFRSLVKAVHPDTTLLEGCVDLGSLAEARDLLLARAARRVAREDVARTQLAAMRLAPATEGDDSIGLPGEHADTADAVTAWSPRRSVMTRAFEAADTVGTVIDLAG